ncbi:ATP-grasp domain-containing protein [Candidatus Margulisiibacteriota bacterium]
MKKLDTIVFLSNTKEISGIKYPHLKSEYGTKKTVQQVLNALSKLAKNVYHLEADEKAYQKLKKLRNGINLVFNMAEGYKGKYREAYFPALLEKLKIPYTGESSQTAKLTFDKVETKKNAKKHKILTPKYQVIRSQNVKTDLQFPLIVKPVYGGSSIGIKKENKVKNKNELKKIIKKMLKKYKPLLIEEFIEGREFSVGLLGNEILQGDEKIFKGKDDFLHKKYKAKGRTKKQLIFQSPIKNLKPSIKKKLLQTAKKAFKVLNCCDLARADFRMDKEENLYLLEINTPPNIVRGSFRIQAESMGYTFDQMIKKIVVSALKRYKMI